MLSVEKGTPAMTNDRKKGSREVYGVNSLSHQEALARGNMYRFLASVFLNPPGQGILERVTDRDFLKELSMLFSEKAVAGLKEFASAPRFDGDLAFLTREYMDLFAVPTGRYVTPFEDVYGEISADGKQERGPLLGNQAILVIRAYREAGAEMEGTCAELPTHIGVELSFMYFLCEKEASASSGRRRDERIRNPWPSGTANSRRDFFRNISIDGFRFSASQFRRMRQATFYKGLALITEEFLAQDTARLLTPRRLSKTSRRSETQIKPEGTGNNGSTIPFECRTECDTPSLGPCGVLQACPVQIG